MAPFTDSTCPTTGFPASASAAAAFPSRPRCRCGCCRAIRRKASPPSSEFRSVGGRACRKTSWFCRKATLTENEPSQKRVERARDAGKVAAAKKVHVHEQRVKLI